MTLITFKQGFKVCMVEFVELFTNPIHLDMYGFKVCMKKTGT